MDDPAAPRMSPHPPGARAGAVRGRRAAAIAAACALLLAAACSGEAPSAAPPPAAPAARLPPMAEANPSVRVASVAADEAELGVPLYPRATIDGDTASRVTTPDGTTLVLTQRSPDPARDVAVFYREAMRVLAQGKELAEIDSADDGSTTLVLGDPAARRAVQVRIDADGVGSRIQVVATRATSP